MILKKKFILVEKNGEIHFIYEYFGHEVVVGVNSDFQINFYMYKKGGGGRGGWGRVEFNRPTMRIMETMSFIHEVNEFYTFIESAIGLCNYWANESQRWYLPSGAE
jgi:hypothetical protein